MANGNHNNNGHHRNGTGNGLVHVNGRKPADTPASSAGQAIVTGHDLLWDGLPPAVTSALGRPGRPRSGAPNGRGAGRTFSYIEGHVAISEANRVFGFGGWGYELVSDVTLRETEYVDPQTGEVKRTRAYSTPVRVTVPARHPARTSDSTP